MTKTTIHELATRTEDAYSAGTYVSWYSCAAVLRERGLSDREVEAFLRSKHLRWAADEAGKSRGATSEDLQRYLNRYPEYLAQPELDELVAGTFPEEGS